MVTDSLVPRLPDLFQRTRALKKIGQPGDEARLLNDDTVDYGIASLY